MSDSREHDDGAGPEESRPAPKSALGGPITGIVVGLASQTVVLTAVLFYFGWARARATYAYFGVDVSVLNFSVSDYVLRSVSTAFPFLIAIGFLALCGLIVHDHLRPSLSGNAAQAARLVRILAWAGGAVVVAGFILAVAITGPGGSAPVGPAAMTAGLAVAAYALMLRDHYVEGNRSRLFVAVLSLGSLALLWSVGTYADYIGIRVAEQIRASLPTASNVVVFSASNLSLAGPGVTVARIAAPDALYRFRYSGLRLLTSSGEQYFLLPAGWRPGTGSVIVLPVTSGGASTRVEFQLPAP